jgi:hypothetical protein
MRPFCVDLFVVGEPEDLREELGQAQAGAKLGDEARWLVCFYGEGVGRVGRDERLAGAHSAAGAADAADDLAFEDLKRSSWKRWRWSGPAPPPGCTIVSAPPTRQSEPGSLGERLEAFCDQRGTQDDEQHRHHGFVVAAQPVFQLVERGRRPLASKPVVDNGA